MRTYKGVYDMDVYHSFCVGVVFYNPTQLEADKIKEYSKIVSKYYVYDNTEREKPDYVNEVMYYDKCEYISHERNDGIAKALNYMCREAKKDGFKYILLLDQDSIFDLANIKLLFESIQQNNRSDIGVYAPESKYIKSIKEYDIYKAETSMINRNDYKEVDWRITSGSVIDLDVFMLVGEFDENLFIDRVDYDYCRYINKYGYKTVVVQNSILYQFLGEAQGGIFNFTQHNYIRHYYIFRNRLYIMNKYKDEYKGTRKIVLLCLSITRHIGKVLLFESDKTRKMKAMKAAYKDYKNNEMGKCEIII
ncbi:hypothetical protein BSK54_22015 [Paenibacillus odorifer]|uniref:glycosyltransferase n=1 Tax=Paenibacillus odorifer TaxID=189426 RepID=UPI00096DA499|nr:glycosyltransferase [Paenibacillus odorifer]OMD98680.1 hypothetical protein BSK54_22015 [Paenibacillus odorifer]